MPEARTFRFTGTEPVRVNKWLAQQGVCSRREAEALIEAGQVSVEGETISSPGHKISPGQSLTLAGRATQKLASKLSVILHKPIGYVSGTPEDDQIPAVRLLTTKAAAGRQPVIPSGKHKLAPVGRLDQDSRGLLIMSEDGAVAKAVIGPEADMEKEYIVRIRGSVSENQLRQLRHGLNLDGRRLKKAVVEQVEIQTLRFVLREGRNRQIRRMCDLVELRVVDLKRIRIGPLELGDLPEGQWRTLTPDERAALIAQPVRKPKPASQRGQPAGAKPTAKPQRRTSPPPRRRKPRPGPAKP
ncbi:MAG: pseudouridine synthase [Pseudomonadota bacterium]